MLSMLIGGGPTLVVPPNSTIKAGATPPSFFTKALVIVPGTQLNPIQSPLNPRHNHSMSEPLSLCKQGGKVARHNLFIVLCYGYVVATLHIHLSTC